MIKKILSTVALAVLLGAVVGPVWSADPITVRIAILRIDSTNDLPISRLDLLPDDLGLVGGLLATEDNQTTGRFLGHDYETIERVTAPDAAVAAAVALAEDDIEIFVVAADRSTLLEIADALGDQALIINAAAEDDVLRNEECRANILHVAPSRAMLTDALAQFLMWKKWREWALIFGSHPEDQALADAYRRSAQKFGAELIDEREFEDTGGARRSDSGYVLVQKQIPVFTQGLGDYDVAVVADEAGVFAEYLPYQTWEPRPVVGSAGLRPEMFHPAHESWGATQFQRRFEKTAQRRVRPLDYQVWLALRAVGEAVTRTNSTNIATLRSFMLGPDFELAAFKGQKVTFRDWNGQLRQPILLTSPKIVVSVSPQAAFLHQVSQLDTLGFDRPESSCKQF